ncbi:hypothetical protein FACS1894186_4700 [Alphaproteobacteria bacterium]|nr:hypothetical protein FACS1894186_4700 [Alphaproteobacteria bacterium]
MTPQRLENIAVYYLARYEASTARLRAVLAARVRRSPNRAEVPEAWLDAVVAKMAASGYVDDARFAEGLVRRGVEAGRSARWIGGKLRAAGLRPEDYLGEEVSEGESARALDYARRKRLAARDSAEFRKFLGRMGRAGFSYDDSKAALATLSGEDMEDSDAEG